MMGRWVDHDRPTIWWSNQFFDRLGIIHCSSDKELEFILLFQSYVKNEINLYYLKLSESIIMYYNFEKMITK